jgi:peptidoglycan hydrolase-like protein with peptidoglycan-binding domain
VKSSNTKAIPANTVSTKTGAAKSAVSKSAAAKSVPGAVKPGVRTAAHTTTANAAGKAPPKRVATRTIPRYTSQQQPTQDRYREIQQALADKGYFHGPVDGTWGTDSMDALKRFQTDQNVDADGKISALSLIALGLGPRRDSAAVRSAPSPDKSSEPSPPPVPEPAQAAPVAVP